MPWICMCSAVIGVEPCKHKNRPPKIRASGIGAQFRATETAQNKSLNQTMKREAQPMSHACNCQSNFNWEPEKHGRDKIVTVTNVTPEIVMPMAKQYMPQTWTYRRTMTPQHLRKSLPRQSTMRHTHQNGAGNTSKIIVKIHARKCMKNERPKFLDM